MDYKIRRTNLEDAKDVWTAHKKSINEICNKDYTEEQRSGWGNFPFDPEFYKGMLALDENHHYVVTVDKKIEGFFHFIDKVDHIIIAGLYFTPALKGKGAGRDVFQRAFELAQNKNIKKMILTSTITSKGFYEKMGFTVLGAGSMNIRGSEVPNFKMEMILE